MSLLSDIEDVRKAIGSGFASNMRDVLHSLHIFMWRQRSARLRAVLAPPPDGLHPKTVTWAHAAYGSLSDVETVDKLARTVARKQGQGHRTAYKWLCERNPMYEPGGSMEKRWESLRTSVERIYAYEPPQ